METTVKCAQCGCDLDIDPIPTVIGGNVVLKAEPCTCLEDDMKELKRTISQLEDDLSASEEALEEAEEAIEKHEEACIKYEAEIEALEKALSDKETELTNAVSHLQSECPM